MNILFVTGISGAGKSTATKFLEDMGFFCIDNMPLPLVRGVVDLFDRKPAASNIAFVVDVRSGEYFEDFPNVIAKTKANKDNNVKVLFLECSGEKILKRYKEQKRMHPLAVNGISNVAALKNEIEMLAPVKELADVVVDTTNYSIWQLKEELEDIFKDKRKEEGIQIEVVSFGFKNGIYPLCDLVFDVRFLPNPFYVPELRAHTGMDDDVYNYVFTFDEAKVFFDKTFDMIKYLLPYYEKEGKEQLIIGFGCTGGQHRSVSMARAMQKKLSTLGYNATLRNIELEGKK